MKKKKETPEDFVGWKSEDGLLEVIGISDKVGTKGRKSFKVICHKCKEDTELFPTGYFISQKDDLKRGRKPCGCSFHTYWTEEQYLILARRAAQGRFIVNGFAEEFHGNRTKINLECLVDGHKWIANLNNTLYNNRGCPKCAVKFVTDIKRMDEQVAFDNCKKICEIENYEPLCFPEGYKNNRSKFEYRCLKHGKQTVKYDKFIFHGNRCVCCWKDRQKYLANVNGYYPERKDETDFLYILNFDDKFIKVGRSFDVERRIGKNQLQKESGISNIIKLRIFTATHQEVYNTEQALLEELRERGFQYHLNWTKECFENECLYSLNKLLDICGLQELTIE